MSKPSALIKIERAESHINEFNRAVRDFIARDPYNFALKRDANAKPLALVLKVKEDVPENFAPIVGDAIHNLRAALDHIVYDLIKPTKAPEMYKIQFPFCPKRSCFESTLTDRFIHLAPKKAVDIIRSLQPYPGGKVPDLITLDKLDIRDKHKLLLTVAAISAVSADVHGNKSGLVAEIREIVGPIKDGLEVVPFVGVGQMEISDDLKPRIDVTFGDGEFKGKEVSVTLRELVAQVSDVVIALQPYL